MKCPMKFNNPCADADDQCEGKKCMWYVYHIDNSINRKVICEGCAIAMIPNVTKMISNSIG